MTSYKELEVWRLAMTLVKRVYVATGTLPRDEQYGLSSQLRRAAVSIPANIAEGYGRNSIKEYIQFIGIASGSQAELETLLLLLKELYQVEDCDAILELNTSVGRMLYRLREALRAKSP